MIWACGPSAQRAREAAGGTHVPLTQIERDRLRVIFMLFVFVVLFWASFEQAGGLMNLYTPRRRLNRFITATTEIPAGYFQSVNSFFIILLAPDVRRVLERPGAPWPQSGRTAEDGVRPAADRHSVSSAWWARCMTSAPTARHRCFG